MGRRRCGRCSLLIWVALAFDAIGLTLILVGIFGELQRQRRDFGDFLIYSGGIVLFFSLLWWLLWYLCNLEVALDELSHEPPRGHYSWLQLVRKVSERLSQGKAARDKKEGPGQLPEKAPLPGLPLSSLVHLNNGFLPDSWKEATVRSPDCSIAGDRLI